MIPQETVDKILDTAQIADVVEDFIPLKRRGANYVACCPFHNEKTPSFYVSPAKGIFKCFGCGKSGTAVGFVMEHESLSYSDALKYLAKKYGIEVREKEESAEDIARRQRSESLYLVSEYAAKFFAESLKTDEGLTFGDAYFKSRGLSDETIAKFGLGWSPSSRHALAKAAREAGYKEEFLVDTGLCVRRDDGSLSDRFYDRVMFPVHSVGGRVIAFGGRTLRSDKTVAKYVNSPETEIYVKSKSLYGIWFAKNEILKKDRCYLVEGYLDVISMHQLGITNVVASSGTSLTVEQVRLIKRFTENVTIIYDGDSAGIHAALRGIGLVLKEGMKVKVVLLPDGDDPDSFSRKHTLPEVEDFIAGHEQDFISFKTDLLLAEAGDDPMKRAALINELADTVALIPDGVARAVYVETCARRFGIEQSLLFERISTTRAGALIAEKKQQDREEDRQRRAQEQMMAAAEGETKVQQTTAPGHNLNDPFLAPCEKELLEFIVLHGRDLLSFDSTSVYYVEGVSMTVADFIRSSLEDDQVEFSNDIYRKVYNLYYEMYDGGLTQEQIGVRLMNSTDPDVAAVSGELLVDKYVITVENFRKALTAEATVLVKFVPRAILLYQKRRLDRMIKECSDTMKDIDPGDLESSTAALEQLKQLHACRKTIMEMLTKK